MATLRRLFQSPFGKLEYYAFARDTTRRVPQLPDRPGVVVRLAVPSDFPRLLNLMAQPGYRGGQMDMAALHRRSEIGDKCFVAEFEGEIATVSWIRFDNATYRKAWLSAPLREGEAYISGTFTLPPFRNMGLGTRVAIERLRWMYDNGIQMAYSWVDTMNPPMLTVMGKTEWHAVAAVTQFYPRGARRPTFNIVRVPDPDNLLAALCRSDRIHFPLGVAYFKNGPAMPRGLTDGLACYNQARQAAVAQPGRAPHL
jgi:GNAT superfamily N-acetyltransferase